MTCVFQARTIRKETSMRSRIDDAKSRERRDEATPVAKSAGSNLLGIFFLQGWIDNDLRD